MSFLYLICTYMQSPFCFLFYEAFRPISLILPPPSRQERERERERQRHRESQIQRQKGRQTGTERERQRESKRQRHRETDRQTETERHRKRFGSAMRKIAYSLFSIIYSRTQVRACTHARARTHTHTHTYTHTYRVNSSPLLRERFIFNHNQSTSIPF